MLKGCVQLSACPDIENTVNMVPVDHVARVVVSSTFNPPVTPLGVVHVTSHPRLRLKDFVGSLQDFGYEVPTVDYYQKWKPLVERYVTASAQAGKEDFALYVYWLLTALGTSPMAVFILPSLLLSWFQAFHFCQIVEIHFLCEPLTLSKAPTPALRYKRPAKWHQGTRVG